MRLKPWQIIVVVVLGIGVFCLVCVAASLFVSMYSSLSISPTVMVENKNVIENTGIPFLEATTELIKQITDTAPSSPTATFTSIPSLTLAPTSDVSMMAAAPCVVDRNPQWAENGKNNYKIVLFPSALITSVVHYVNYQIRESTAKQEIC